MTGRTEKCPMADRTTMHYDDKKPWLQLIIAAALFPFWVLLLVLIFIVFGAPQLIIGQTLKKDKGYDFLPEASADGSEIAKAISRRARCEASHCGTKDVRGER